MIDNDTDYFQPHYDPDTPTPLAPCSCRGCASQGFHPPGPDCIYA